MKKKVLAAILLAVGVLTGCGNSEPISSPIQTVEAEPIATDTKEVEQPAATESSADEVAPKHSYRSELTNEWIDEDLKDQRPIAVMVDNERTALPHFGTADADVVYEIMNSTLNDRITRFMVVVKDWEKIEQLGSIRSARPTNFMLAASRYDLPVYPESGGLLQQSSDRNLFPHDTLPVHSGQSPTPSGIFTSLRLLSRDYCLAAAYPRQ